MKKDPSSVFSSCLEGAADEDKVRLGHTVVARARNIWAARDQPAQHSNTTGPREYFPSMTHRVAGSLGTSLCISYAQKRSPRVPMGPYIFSSSDRHPQAWPCDTGPHPSSAFPDPTASRDSFPKCGVLTEAVTDAELPYIVEAGAAHRGQRPAPHHTTRVRLTRESLLCG